MEILNTQLYSQKFKIIHIFQIFLILIFTFGALPNEILNNNKSDFILIPFVLFIVLSIINVGLIYFSDFYSVNQDEHITILDMLSISTVIYISIFIIGISTGLILSDY